MQACPFEALILQLIANNSSVSYQSPGQFVCNANQYNHLQQAVMGKIRSLAAIQKPFNLSIYLSICINTIIFIYSSAQ